MTPLGHCDAFGRPIEGSLWERHDEVYKVVKVYEASVRDKDSKLRQVTLVKVICVEPMPCHPHVGDFLATYTPYDPEAE